MLKAELADLEQRLAALSQPLPPRPSKGVAEALASERVPVGVWQDSQECARIRGSRYFEKACAKVLDLRRELGREPGLRDDRGARRGVATRVGRSAHRRHPRPPAGSLCRYRRSASSARRRRRRCSPSDPGGRDHELLWARRRAGAGEEQPGGPAHDSDRRDPSETPLERPRRAIPGMVPGEPAPTTTRSSLKTDSVGARPTRRQRLGRPPMSSLCRRHRPKELARTGGERRRPTHACTPRRGPSPCVRIRPGAAAADTWCVARCLRVVGSVRKVAVHGVRARAAITTEARHGLASLGFAKWKSCGLIRYRDLRLAA